MCGTCCYGKGGIVVEKDDIERISNFLGISSESFIAEYCENRNSKTSIRTETGGACVFFHKEKMCLIHPVKPAVCSLWPFFSANVSDKFNWDMAKDACPGINPDCTFEDFVKQSKKYLDGIT